MKSGLNTINTYVLNAQPGETVPLSVTATSGSVAFALASSKLNADIVVYNAGTKTAFIAFGDGATTAVVPGTSGTVNATPILAGAIMTFQKNTDALKCDTCAAICGGSDTTSLYFTSIQGS